MVADYLIEHERQSVGWRKYLHVSSGAFPAARKYHCSDVDVVRAGVATCAQAGAKLFRIAADAHGVMTRSDNHVPQDMVFVR